MNISFDTLYKIMVSATFRRKLFYARCVSAIVGILRRCQTMYSSTLPVKRRYLVKHILCKQPNTVFLKVVEDVVKQ